MAHILFQSIGDKYAVPIHCVIRESQSDIATTLFQSLLEALLNVPNDVRNFAPVDAHEQFPEKFTRQLTQLEQADVEFRKRLQDTGGITLEYVRSAFERRVGRLSEGVNRVVFLIDGLDKQRPKDVLSFFRTSQETLNDFMTRYKCVFVISAEPSWIATLDTGEFSGVKGTAITLRSWTAEETIQLVTKRINTLGAISPFTSDALELVRENADGNPRKILQDASALLREAARQKADVIGPGMVSKMVWSGERRNALFSLIAKETRYRLGFERLRRHASDQTDMRIISTISERHILKRSLSYQDRADLGITLKDEEFERRIGELVRDRCLRLGDSRRAGSQDGYLELDPEVNLIFDWVIKEKLPFYPLAIIFDEFHSEIRTPIPQDREEGVRLEDVRQVFKQTPNDWLDSKEVVDALLKPPGARTAFEERYGAETDSTLRKLVPSLIEHLLRDQQLIRDFDSGKMRWRGEKIDSDLVQLLRHRDEIEDYEAVQTAFNEKDDEALRVASQQLVRCALRRFCDLVGTTYDEPKLDNVAEALRQHRVDLRGLTSLKKLLMLKREAHDYVKECGGRKILLNTVEEYATRLHQVIDDHEDARKSIDDLILREESETLEHKSTLLWDIKLGKRSNDIEHAVAKTMAAFMHAKGGILVLGVDPNHNVLGLENDFSVMRESKKPSGSDQDAFGLRFQGVIEKFLGKGALIYSHIYWHDKEGKKIATVKIDPSHGPFWLKGPSGKEFYIRHNNKSDPLDGEETAKYIKRRWPDWKP
jgi:hypothetical protein